MKRVGPILILLSIVIALAGFLHDLASQPVAAAEQASSRVAVGHRTSVERVPGIVSAINAYRATRGLSAVHLDDRLNESAQDKVEDLVQRHYWSHIATDGTTAWDLIHRAGYEYADAGENLAKCYMNGSEVVNAWIKSPSHRDVMLSDYQDIGIGAKTDGGCTYVAAHFGRQ